MAKQEIKTKTTKTVKKVKVTDNKKSSGSCPTCGRKM